MRLHSIAPFHTLAARENSHCAFTGLAIRFAKMMRAQGFEVVEYANESESEANERVPMMTAAEVKKLSNRKSDRDFFDADLKIGGPLWKLFDRKLRRELTRRFDPDEDIVCHGFGAAHKVLAHLLGGNHVEPSIGYNMAFAQFRVFASAAWMHYHQGKDGRGGNNYEWVVPHFVDVDEWDWSPSPGSYLLYLGRIQCDKGMRTISALAGRTKLPIVVCGQGDFTPWAHKNVEVRPPVLGKERNALIAGARAMLLPTEYTEPGSVASIEALVCGTPVISSGHGVFTERVHNGENGFRCQTFGDYLAAIDRLETLDRSGIALNARATYSLETVGRRFKSIFEQIRDLRNGAGWYSVPPRNI